MRGAQGGAGGEGTGAVESADSAAMIGAGAGRGAVIGESAGRIAVIGASRAGAWLLAGLAALLLFAFPYAERTRTSTAVRCAPAITT